MKNLNSEYEGGAFHCQLPKGKAGGMVYTDGSTLAFQSEGLLFQLPLDGIEIKMGGAGDRLIFFSHPDHPDQTIYSRDSKLLNDPGFRSHQFTRRQRKDVQLKQFKKRVWLFTACALVFVIFSSAYLLKDPVFDIVAKSLPPGVEDSLGKNFVKQYKVSNVFVESEEVDEQLHALVEPLVTSIASDRYDFRFYVVQDPSLNAFALPGGHIVIHTGLIMGASKAEEILGVIAHEIAHVERQHGIRKVLENTGLYAVIAGLFGDVSAITAVFLSNGAFLLQQQFSRDFEREADMLAVTYLENAGINPSGLYDFFAKLKNKEAEEALGTVSDALSILSRHPATSERMDSLQKAIDKKNDSSYNPINFDLKAFQMRLYETADEKVKP